MEKNVELDINGVMGVIRKMVNEELSKQEKEKKENILELTDVVEETNNNQVQDKTNDFSFLSGANQDDKGIELSPKTEEKIRREMNKVHRLDIPISQKQSSLPKDINLEVLTKQLLTPYLEKWLERHLPDITERLVKEKINQIQKSDHAERI